MGQVLVLVVFVVLSGWSLVTVAAFLRAGKLRDIHTGRDAGALADLVHQPVPAGLALGGTWLLVRGRVLGGPLAAIRAYGPAPMALVLVDRDELFLAEPTLLGGRAALVQRGGGELERYAFGLADPARRVVVTVVLDSGPYEALGQLGWLPDPRLRS